MSLYRREDLDPGDAVRGPAVIVEANATTVVEPGWTATLNDLGHLVLSRAGAAAKRQAIGTDVDPVRLEIFNNLFMSIAEQMGYRLQSTAHSVNVKERLDFSCAIFDIEGNLIVNAPHMPVHLGSMGESVKEVIAARRGTMKPGDAYVLNDPYHGGTHLPDVTVITPVFSEDGGEILFYVASRGHHAEIGGITPCSMPAFSTRIEEEGVLIRNWLLVENGRLREAETAQMLRSAPHPSRNPAPTSRTCAPRSPPTRRACGNCEPWSITTASTWSAPTWATCRTTPRSRCAGSSPSCRTAAYAYELDNGAVINVTIRVDRARRHGRDRLHRDVRAAAGQLQRAVSGGDGGRPVRVPHPGRRRHPAQLRLPEAAAGDHPARHDAVAGVPGRGRGRQRGDLPGGHRGAVRGAGHHGRGLRAP